RRRRGPARGHAPDGGSAGRGGGRGGDRRLHRGAAAAGAGQSGGAADRLGRRAGAGLRGGLPLDPTVIPAAATAAIRDRWTRRRRRLGRSRLEAGMTRGFRGVCTTPTKVV